MVTSLISFDTIDFAALAFCIFYCSCSIGGK